MPFTSVLLGIIADVHSNLPALQAVLDKLAGVEKIICVGDIVGYGAFPNEVIELLREEKVTCTLGNHDYAVITGDTSWFNPYAQKAIEFTRAVIKPENLKLLGKLPKRLELGNILFVHGSPRDELFEYVYPWNARYYSIEGKLLVVGHSHVQFFKNNVLNPGSVGQPRDRNPDAAFAIVNTETRQIKLLRVRYDIDEAANAIIDAGLPPFLAERLYLGV